MTRCYGHRTERHTGPRPLAPICGERVWVRSLNPPRGAVNAYVRDLLVPVTVPVVLAMRRDRPLITWIVVL